MLSIIIPTKNEEKLLPLLLQSIKNQDIKYHEIIVADGGSTDRTCDIASNCGCEVVLGESPAKARNNGAKAASGDLLLFLDADVVLDGNLSVALDEFERRRLDVASCCLTLRKSRVGTFLCKIVYNLPIRLLERTLPHGDDFILARKAMHEMIDGFDEEVRIAEVHDYVRRAAKFGSFGLLRSMKISTSARRYEISGVLRVGLAFIALEMHMVLVGPVKYDFFLFKFDDYCDERRVLKTLWAKFTGWKATLFIIWLISAASLLFLWYIVVVLLFLGLNLRNKLLKPARWIRRPTR